jgi:hypothetical protein
MNFSRLAAGFSILFAALVAVPRCVVGDDSQADAIASERALASDRRPIADANAELVDIEFSRKGAMRMVLKEDALELETPYGELKIPVEEVLSIEFATRLSESEVTGIAVAIVRCRTYNSAHSGNASEPHSGCRRANEIVTQM